MRRKAYYAVSLVFFALWGVVFFRDGISNITALLFAMWGAVMARLEE